MTQNKYRRYYNNIIAAAQSRETPALTERHHIVPRSLGGSDDDSNIVCLTPREHFICHLLLTKFTEGEAHRSMVYAVAMMSRTRGVKLSGRTYERIRMMHIKTLKQSKTGRKFVDLSEAEQNAMRKMWNAKRGVKLSPEAIAKRQQTRAERGIVSNPPNHTGRTRSESTKQKIANLRWYNDGSRNVRTSGTPPEGFVPGKLTRSR